MTAWMLVLGTGIVIAVLIDALITTISTNGAGPLSAPLISGLWKLTHGLHRRTGRRQVLVAAGPVILLSSVFVWILALWAGWLLVFSASPEAVVDSTTNAPADPWARLYFTGYAIFTLGNGDYKPSGALFQAATPLVTITGLFLVTLAITYLIPVASAAVDARRLALSVKGMGETPEGILLNAWDGSGFPGLELLLVSISPMVTLQGERHLAYPILHYYGNARADISAPVRLAALDEALTLLAHGVAPAQRPSAAVLNAARSAVSSYLRTLQSMYVGPAREAPPAPHLDRLKRAGIPVVDDDAFGQALVQFEKRRRLLLANVQSTGWGWEDVGRTSGAP